MRVKVSNSAWIYSRRLSHGGAGNGLKAVVFKIPNIRPLDSANWLFKWLAWLFMSHDSVVERKSDVSGLLFSARSRPFAEFG